MTRIFFEEQSAHDPGGCVAAITSGPLGVTLSINSWGARRADPVLMHFGCVRDAEACATAWRERSAT